MPVFLFCAALTAVAIGWQFGIWAFLASVILFYAGVFLLIIIVEHMEYAIVRKNFEREEREHHQRLSPGSG